MHVLYARTHGVRCYQKNQPRVLNIFFVGIAPYATPDSQQRYIIILLLQAIIPKSVTVTCNNRTPRIVNKYCSTMAVLNYTALIGGDIILSCSRSPTSISLSSTLDHRLTFLQLFL